MWRDVKKKETKKGQRANKKTNVCPYHLVFNFISKSV